MKNKKNYNLLKEFLELSFQEKRNIKINKINKKFLNPKEREKELKKVKSYNDYEEDITSNTRTRLINQLESLAFCVGNKNPKLAVEKFYNSDVDNFSYAYIYTLLSADTSKGTLMSKLNLKKYEEITAYDKLHFLEVLCKNLIEITPKDFQIDDDWVSKINKEKEDIQYAIQITDREYRFSAEIKNIIDERFKKLYSHYNGGHIPVPLKLFNKDEQKQYEIDDIMFPIIDTTRTELKYIDYEDREYMIEKLKERIIKALDEWEECVYTVRLKELKNEIYDIEEIF